MKKWFLPLIAGLALYTSHAQTLESDPASLTTQRDPQILAIESDIKNRYALDTLGIHFEVVPKDFPLAQLGIYSSWTDSLKLNYFEIQRSAERLGENPDTLLGKVMKHELAHIHVDKFLEKRGLKPAIEDRNNRDVLEVYFYFLNLNEKSNSYSSMTQKYIGFKEKELTSIILDKVIDEGIGYYYEDPSKLPIAVVWPSSIYAIKNNSEFYSLICDVGKSLVYPILSRYGEQGLEYILTHMPTDFNLKKYQEKTLEELETLYPSK